MKLIDPNIVKYVIGKYEVPTDFDHKYCSTWIKEANEMNDRFAEAWRKSLITYDDSEVVKRAKEQLNERQLNHTAQYKPKPATAYSIKNVIFNPPATIVFWADNTKTVVKCVECDEYDPEKGLAMAFVKKIMGNHGNYYNIFRKWLPKEDEKSPIFNLNKPGTFSFTFEPMNIRVCDTLGKIFDLGTPTDIKMEGESDE